MTVISVENLSKAYRLGQIGTGRLVDDLKVWWAKTRGRPNPFLKIGQKDHGNSDGETIWALKDISFDVKQGEVLGIIGRNGAGKSTLLKILTGVTAPTSGQIRAKGRVASLLEVGTGFHPDLTGRENIYLNGAILGMKKAEIARQFDEIVAFSEVEQFIDTPVKRYSSGMYVRLAFAVAAHLEPEILLVDEVLAVGDVAFQKKCLGKMGDVAKGGRTVLFVSHNMGSIQNLCHRALLVEAGRLTREGLATDVVDHYLLADLHDNTFAPSAGTRIGDQRAMITDFTVRPIPVKTGSPTEFVFTISRPTEGVPLLAELAVDILTEQSVPLLHLSSLDMGVDVAIPRGTTVVSARLGALPLSPGRYFVNLWLGTGNTVVDWIQGCLVLRVDVGRVSGHEFVSTSHPFPVLVPSSWHMS